MPRMTTSVRPTQHKVVLSEASKTLERQSDKGRYLYRCSRHTNLVYAGTGPRCPVCDVEGQLETSSEKALAASREADRLRSQVGMLKAVNEHSAAMNNAVKEMDPGEQALLKDMVYAHVTGDLRQTKPILKRKQVTKENVGSYTTDRVVGISYRMENAQEWDEFMPESIGGKAFLLPFFESMKVAGTKRTMHHVLVALKHGAADVVNVDVLIQASSES